MNIIISYGALLFFCFNKNAKEKNAYKIGIILRISCEERLSLTTETNLSQLNESCDFHSCTEGSDEPAHVQSQKSLHQLGTKT